MKKKNLFDLHQEMFIWKVYPSPENITQALIAVLVTFRKSDWMVYIMHYTTASVAENTVSVSHTPN